MITHHPGEDLLQEYAAGKMNAGAALVTACHLEVCAACRREVASLDTLGGVLLEQSTPAPLGEGAVAKALARIGNETPAKIASKDAMPPRFLQRFALPRRLARQTIGSRRWVAPGVWFAPIKMEPESRSLTYLVYAARNTALPRHTHEAREFTAILTGGYDDGLGNFIAGDFSDARNDQWHAPSVTHDEACLCLINSDGPMELQGFVARLIQSAVGGLY
jgi:putative transcriptional regulator